MLPGQSMAQTRPKTFLRLLYDVNNLLKTAIPRFALLIAAMSYVACRVVGRGL